MTPFFRITFLALFALLTGCAANVQRSGTDGAPVALSTAGQSRIVLTVRGSDVATKSADWEMMRAEWRTAMSAAAAAKGIAFAYQEADIKPSADGGTAVTVKINDYRYVSAGARFGLGIMTGNAFLDTDVTFADLKTGRAAGTRKYNTTSSAWQGIFSAMTTKQVEGMCTEIVKEVAGR